MSENDCSGSRARSVAVFILLAVVGAVLIPATALAVVAVEKTLRELVRQADVIVVGVVDQMQSMQLPDGPIVTDVHLDVSRVLKGPKQRSLVLRLLGGKVGDTELRVEGAPTFGIGQEVLLFVRGNGIEALPFVGIQHGVFRFARGSSPETHGVFDWRGHPVTGLKDGRVVVGTPSDAPVMGADLLSEIARELGR